MTVTEPTRPRSRQPVISAVLFDLDRTLIDLERATRLAIGAHVGPEAYPEWKRLERLHVQRYVDGVSTIEGQRRDRVREMTGEPMTDERADAWFAAYRARLETELRLFEDTVAALDHIEAGLGVPVGIVTNMETDYQLAKMTAVGLDPGRFACFLGTDRLPAPKPSPEAFRHACAVLGLPVDRSVVFVGDEPNTDALGAHRAGLRGVWLDRPDGLASLDPDPPAWVERITGLAQLPALLGRP
ncbi:MAG: HAD family hydrolase, partial [Actinocrinis sp.]